MKKKFLFFIFLVFFLLYGCKGKESASKNIQIREPIINEILGEKLIEVPIQTPTLCVSGGVDIDNKDEMIKSLDILKSAGFEVIRRDFLWEELEPEENKIDEAKLQKYKFFVEEAKKRGIDIIAIVSFGNIWASESARNCFEDCKSKCNNCLCNSICSRFAPDPNKYQKFAEFLVKEFPDINRFEIWNEPNWYIFMQPTPSPEIYADIFISARSSIKKHDEKKEVILGGLLMSEITEIPSSVLYIWYEFLGKLRERGVLDLADSIAIHPYIGPKPIPYPPSLPPEDSRNSAGSLIYYITYLRKIMKSFALTQKPIHITEIGWPANYSEKTGEAYGTARFISEESQASFIIRSFIISTMLGVKTFCVYTLKDLPADLSVPHEAERYFGILRENFIHKKSYEAIKFTMPRIKGKYIGDVKTEIIGGTKNETNKDEKNDMKLVFSPVFEGEDKRLRAVIWVVQPDGTEEKEKIKVKVYIPENTDLFSIYGERIVEYEKVEGYIILDISSNPVIAEIK